jgi:hypothetical protein
MPEIKISSEWLAKEREIKELRKDMNTAYKIIADGLARYKKKMLHAKNKKQTENLSMFVEIDIYESKKEIHDAFGWGYISESEMKRFYDLWDARETVNANNGKYTDRVTEILERALNSCGDKFFDTLKEHDKLVRQGEENRIRIERENSINNYNRYKAGL